MTLPIGISVPHAWGEVPLYIQPFCALTVAEIAADRDEGSAMIYQIASHVQEFVSTPIARTILDMNRAEDDRSRDGVVKTHTREGVPIYQAPLSEELTRRLIEEHHRPYHRAISEFAGRVRLGIDCHTVAPGLRVGPDHRRGHPLVYLCDGDGSCPKPWIDAIARCFIRHFAGNVTVNKPVCAGHTARTHGREMPWIQLKLCLSSDSDGQDNRLRVISALRDWCELDLLMTSE